MATRYHVGDVAAIFNSKEKKQSSNFSAFYESNVTNKVNSAVDQPQDVKSEPKLKRKPRKRKVNTDEVNKSVPKKVKKIKIDDDPEVNLRTIFVGNVPTTVDKKTLKDLFKPYGKIETIRFRSAPLSDLKTPRKVAVIFQRYHEDRHNLNAFIKFASKESAENAVELNGHKLDGFILRVDLASNSNQQNHKNSIFVGNLPFAIEENSLYEHFEEYGDIESVRIIRDKKSGVGKGFGYVNFKSEDSVNLALKIASKPLNERILRIKRSMTKEKLENKKNRDTKSINSETLPKKKERSNLNFQGETAKLKIKKKKKKLPKIKPNKQIYFNDKMK